MIKALGFRLQAEQTSEGSKAQAQRRRSAGSRTLSFEISSHVSASFANSLKSCVGVRLKHLLEIQNT
jgi:hypothetical protein